MDHNYELRLRVPTYNANRYPAEVAAKTKEEYGEPYRTVRIREEDGLRVILESPDDIPEMVLPDLMIERQPVGWAIFLRAGSTDEGGVIYLRDDGQTFLARDEYAIRQGFGVQVLEPGKLPPGFEEIKPEETD
jgi:hypothetical protein